MVVGARGLTSEAGPNVTVGRNGATADVVLYHEILHQDFTLTWSGPVNNAPAILTQALVFSPNPSVQRAYEAKLRSASLQVSWAQDYGDSLSVAGSFGTAHSPALVNGTPTQAGSAAGPHALTFTLSKDQVSQLHQALAREAQLQGSLVIGANSAALQGTSFSVQASAAFQSTDSLHIIVD
jgi:hypothetical protein